MTSSSSATWAKKVVLVTGASSGLGKALAAEFAAQGAHVILTARGAEMLQATAREITAAGGSATPIVADVTDDQSVARLFAQIIQQHDRLDVLVNNVGLSTRKSVCETTAADVTAQMEINFHSLVRCTHTALPHLKKSRGRIINIGSLASKVGTRFMGGYPASKHAVAAYSQQLRMELNGSGVSVLLVCPGPIARDVQRSYSAEEDDSLPDHAAEPGSGAKIKALDPVRLASKVVSAAAKRKPEIVVPGKARLLFTIAQLSPRLGDWLLRKFT
ncbi:MAG: SDR family NAD(P)-dependent oxidoreductase [Pirellulales bacterium]|nr:SDR family NAD(P)-dependent oxidoreductase [Pirellulales bacterium]